MKTDEETFQVFTPAPSTGAGETWKVWSLVTADHLCLAWKIDAKTGLVFGHSALSGRSAAALARRPQLRARSAPSAAGALTRRGLDGDQTLADGDQLRLPGGPQTQQHHQRAGAP